MEPDSETRPVLVPAGNRAKILESKTKMEGLKNSQKTKKLATRLPKPVIQSSASVNSSCSSDSSCSISSVKMANFRGRTKRNGLKSVKVVPDGIEVPVIVKRCDWITTNSDVHLFFTDPLYASFHDEEWGVPVHDDRKLFELLVLSAALAELSWPTILNKRKMFRETFENFDPASIAKFTEKKILAWRASGNTLLSEQKLRAVVENARQILKVQDEFGSLDNYCWSFVNHNPIRNGYRYTRQVPVKTPKAEAMSKDLMRRGFRCVGPTVVYSFMQVAGMVNDHILTCFRYQECNSSTVKKVFEALAGETEVMAKSLENTRLSSL